MFVINMSAPDANMFVIDAAIERCTHVCGVSCSQLVTEYINSCAAIDSQSQDRLVDMFLQFDEHRDAKKSVTIIEKLSKEYTNGVMKQHADTTYAIVDAIKNTCAECETEILLHVKPPVLPDVPPKGRVTSAGLRRNAMIHMYATLKKGIHARITVIQRHLQHTYIEKLNRRHGTNITHTTGFYSSLVSSMQEEASIDIDTSYTQDVSEYTAQPWAIHNNDVSMRGSVSVGSIYKYLSNKLEKKIGILDLPPPKISRVCMYCNTAYTGTQKISDLSSPYTKGVLWDVFLRPCPKNMSVRCCDMLVYRRCYDIMLVGIDTKPAEMGDKDIIDDNDEYIRSIRKERKSMYDYHRYTEKKKKVKVTNLE